MTLRDGGYDFEDGCPECGAGVREYEERGRMVARCKEDPDLCGWCWCEGDDNGDE